MTTAAVDRTAVGRGLGWACVTAGGLIAAVTGPLGLDKGSWLAAYLVLVCGLGGCAAARRDADATEAVPRWLTTTRALGWLVGNTAVVTGALTRTPPVVDLGTAMLLVGIVAALFVDVRGTSGNRADRWGPAYRALLVVFAVSAPVGAVLSHLRAG